MSENLIFQDGRRSRSFVASSLLVALVAAGCAGEVSDETEHEGDAPTELMAVGAADAGRGTDAGAGHGGHDMGSTSAWCEAKQVLDQSCAGCHDGQGTAGTPMGLTSYADLIAPAPSDPSKKVYQTVSQRTHDTARPMPPRGVLPAATLAPLDSWIAAGAPAGDDPTCSGETGGPGDGGFDWDKECDAIYPLRSHGAGGPGTPYLVQPGGEYHPQIRLDAPWGNEQVQAIAFRGLTDNKKVLHHWILYAGMAFLTGWAPGDDVKPPYPDDVGMDMPTGKGALRLDMHYYNTGNNQVERDNSGVEICVVKKANFRKNHAAVTMGFTSFGPVLAPARTTNYQSTGTCKVTTTQPVHLLTAAPHAHKLATHMKFTVKKKNGQTIVMHDQPFRFGEQGTYALDPEVILETGDTVTTTCTFTNPTNRNVTFGESTENEMCFNFATYWPKGALRCGGGLFGR